MYVVLFLVPLQGQSLTQTSSGMYLYEEQKSKYQGVTDSKSKIKMHYEEQ